MRLSVAKTCLTFGERWANLANSVSQNSCSSNLRHSLCFAESQLSLRKGCSQTQNAPTVAFESVAQVLRASWVVRQDHISRTAMETALASRVFAHPTVQAIEKAQIDGWQDLGRVFVKAFDERGQKYSIDFDDAWVWLEYARKDSALRTLKGQFTEGVDYTDCPGQAHRDVATGTLQGWTPDKYYLTTNAFEDFAMAARTDAGKLVRAFFRAIRDAYVELTTQGQLALSQEQALTMAYHKKNVIYIGEVRAKGENIERLCKVGQTSDIAKRCDLHKQTFRSPFYFQLLPWLRWTTGSGLKVFSKNCPRYVRSSAGSTSASWARRSSSLCRTASPRRSWSYACVEQLVCDSRRPPVG
jgi:hypothetical protein